MSINQISDFLTSGPQVRQAPGNTRQMFVFVYDHHFSWLKFQAKIQSSRPVGIGKLENWTFHVNEKGLPNIRIPYLNGNFTGLHNQQFVLPNGATQITRYPRGPCAYGWVFRMPQADDAALHQVLSHGGHRIRRQEYISCLINSASQRALYVPVIFYWDARYTGNYKHSIVIDRQERYAWENGLHMLARNGVPAIDIMKLSHHLEGVPDDIEPVTITPTLLPKSIYIGEHDPDEDVIYDSADTPTSNTPSPPRPRHKVTVSVRENVSIVVKGAAINRAGRAVRFAPPNRVKGFSMVNSRDSRPVARAETVQAVRRARDLVVRDVGEQVAKRQRRLSMGSASRGQKKARRTVHFEDEYDEDGDEKMEWNRYP